MREVAIRELNQQTAAVLARVERGERVAITRNGRRIAILEPSDPTPFTGMIEAGEFQPAAAPLPLPSTTDALHDSAGLDAVLEDRYGSERW